MARTERSDTSHIEGHGLTKAGTITCAVEQSAPSEDRRMSAIDLAIIRENLSRPRMFLRWIDGRRKLQRPDQASW